MAGMGACVARGVYGRGHVWWQGACMAGGIQGRGHAWQGECMVGGMHGRRYGHCSGWYASNWNAFFLLVLGFRRGSRGAQGPRPPLDPRF